jgi:glycosyltransferase involved in cell wall biosynthesis
LYCDSNIQMAERGAASGHSHASTLSPTELQRIRAREAQVYRGAAAIFTISEELRRSFIDDFGVDASRVRTVHAGPNFDVRSMVTNQTTRAKAAGAPPTVLFVGRQFERKGGDVLLSAFATVRERIPLARLLVVGPSHLTDVPPGVECLGFLDKDDERDRDRLLSAYACADVFCLPTRFEPFGIVFLEAMYFGLPCVGTNAWAVPEMITDGVTGFLVPIDDPRELADRLTRLLLDDRLARGMGSAGRERAASYFSWSAVVDRMMQSISVSAATAEVAF